MAITNSTIAQAVNDLVDYWDSFNVEYAAWLTGVVGGGPNLDGEYPLTDYLGNVTLTLCPAALEDSVNGVVDSANTYATAAQAAQTAAEAAQTAAELAETNSDTSEAQALSYRDAALAAQTAAESARTTAIAQADVSILNSGYASEWAITVEDTLVSVAAGGNGTTDYSSLHHAAKASADAVAAAASAAAALVSETNAAASEAAAATFDPALYAALADNETITGAWTFSNYLTLTPMAAPAWAEGILYYDSTEKAISYYNDEADVTINLGQENVIRARNTTGVTISNGAVVYISGAQGANLPLISLAQADALATAEAIGVVTHDIENNSNGYVTTLGVVRDLNTSTYTAGDELFLSTSVAGGLTNVKPTTGYAIPIGYVTVVNVSVGEIKVTMHAEPVSQSDQANWTTAYGWGDHSVAGYAVGGDLADYLPLAGGTMSGLLTVNSQILGGSGYGTPTLPSFTSTQDSNTGFYVESSDVAAISTGGVKRLDVDSTGLDLHVPLSIDGLVDNDVLIHFNMDRPWTFLSKGEDANNQLELQSINDKHFVISDSLGAVQFTFETDSGDLIVANDVEANSVLGQAAASGLTNSFNAISNGPSFYWSESDQILDEKGWKMWGSGGAFKFYTTNDSGVATGNIFEVQRTGTTVDKVLFGTPIQTNSAIETNPGTGFAQLTERALFLDGKSVIEQADTTWLRLNQNGDFTSGIYSPNDFRCDGRFHVNSTIFIENGTTGSIRIGDTGITPNVDIGCRNSSYCHLSTTAGSGFYYYDNVTVVGTANIKKASHGNFLYHQGTYNADQAGGVTFSTSTRTGGVSGDIWFKYT